MNKFPERLKSLREDKGLSLMALSQLVSLDDSSLSRWENGISDIKSEQLIVLAKFFEVSTDYLLGLKDYD